MIYLTIEGQEMAGILTAPLVAGQVNFVEVKTIFDSTWDGLNKSYQFRNGDHVNEVDSNEEIISLPYEATANSGTLEINVVGTKLDDDGVTVLKKATTNTLRFKVGCCNLADDPDNCGDVSATVVEQIRQIAETAEDKATEAERISAVIWEAYNSGALNGKDGKDGKDGTVGKDGADGISPTVATEQTSTGAKITITDVNGTQTVELKNGKDGKDGEGGGIESETDPLYSADKPKLALKTELPTKVSQLTNDKNYISSYTETDPTVPSWAKQSTKPTYTKSEVGLGSVDNVKQYSVNNPPPYPVKSVNGKTGAVVVDVPTKTSQLTNDSKFATTDYVDEEIATFDFIKVVDSLPSTGLENRIYFVPKSDGETQDLFDEYAWVNDAWEYITTKQMEVDLTNYATKDELANKQDTLVSGTNIKTINNQSILGNGNLSIAGGSGGSNPTGTIISFMGMIAPEGYLICDGSELNIDVFPDLATHFETQFGSKSYFGGDGETTFAVPDLRNEFLRGYGDLSSDVGIHQDGTEIPNISIWNASTTQSTFVGYLKNGETNNYGNRVQNEDTFITSDVQKAVGTATQAPYTSAQPHSFTSRPTNVAVLYCIKY